MYFGDNDGLLLKNSASMQLVNTSHTLFQRLRLSLCRGLLSLSQRFSQPLPWLVLYFWLRRPMLHPGQWSSTALMTQVPASTSIHPCHLNRAPWGKGRGKGLLPPGPLNTHHTPNAACHHTSIPSFRHFEAICHYLTFHHDILT